MKIYHATEHDIEKFNLDWLWGSEAAYGLGVYFSLRNDNIDYYLGSDGYGRIYETELSSTKELNLNSKINSKEIEPLLDIISKFIIYDRDKMFNILSNCTYKELMKLDYYDRDDESFDFINSKEEDHRSKIYIQEIQKLLDKDYYISDGLVVVINMDVIEIVNMDIPDIVKKQLEDIDLKTNDMSI